MYGDSWFGWLDQTSQDVRNAAARQRKRRQPVFPPFVERLEDRSTPTVVTLGTAADNTLYEDPTGNLSNGAGQHLFVGDTQQGANEIRRALLKFDLSTIPAGATINSAVLTLNMSKTDNGAQTIGLHDVQKNWGEGASVAGLGGAREGAGIQAKSGDATWLFTFFNTQSWTTPGGDFSATVTASTSVGFSGVYQWSGSGVNADVQNWLNTPASNFGWVLTGNETTSPTSKEFDSKENTTPANRPSLQIDFTAGSSVTHFTVSGPASATAGAPATVTVTALSQSNNTVPSYTGTVHFTSVDSQGVLPSDYTFVAADAGVHIFSATLKTTGNQTITATDTTTGSITGVSGAVAVVAPIAVQGVQFNDGSIQRSAITSITVSFSRAVGTVDDGAFQVIAQAGASGNPTVVVGWNAARTAATLTFTGSLIVGGSLQDGNFSLVTDSSKIHDATGGVLDGNGDGLSGGARAADAFFRLFGDSDGNRVVDNLDLFRFRQSFGLNSSNAGFKSYFDYDANLVVDNLDLFRFRQRFGTTLGP